MTIKRKRRKKPTALMPKTKQYYESLGYSVDTVERFICGIGIRKDLFGLFDQLAINKHETIGVQTTSAANHRSHVVKLTGPGRKRLDEWLANPYRTAVVISWKKIGRKWEPFVEILK